MLSKDSLGGYQVDGSDGRATRTIISIDVSIGRSG